MRIISGLAKGRRLSPPKTTLIRPAADKVKEAIFNILGPIEDAKILDLFAGTGSVGLEALSRGASLAVFVDCLPQALKLIRQNSAACHFEDHAVIVRGKIPAILKALQKKGAPFDYVFIDPPYDHELIEPTLKTLVPLQLVNPQSTIIIEHSPREKFTCEDFKIEDVRKYGQTWVSFLTPLFSRRPGEFCPNKNRWQSLRSDDRFPSSCGFALSSSHSKTRGCINNEFRSRH